MLGGATQAPVGCLAGHVGRGGSMMSWEKSPARGKEGKATVDAKGNSGGLLEVFNGTIDPALGTERIHGVAVQAHSTENVFSIAAAGSLGSKLGLAGAASIALIDSDTAAFVEYRRRIRHLLTSTVPADA